MLGFFSSVKSKLTSAISSAVFLPSSLSSKYHCLDIISESSECNLDSHTSLPLTENYGVSLSSLNESTLPSELSESDRNSYRDSFPLWDVYEGYIKGNRTPVLILHTKQSSSHKSLSNANNQISNYNTSSSFSSDKINKNKNNSNSLRFSLCKAFIKTLKTILHPIIPRVYDIYEGDTNIFVVLEWLYPLKSSRVDSMSNINNLSVKNDIHILKSKSYEQNKEEQTSTILPIMEKPIMEKPITDSNIYCFHKIVEGLIFLLESCNILPLRLNITSILINAFGDYKIGSLETLSPITFPICINGLQDLSYFLLKKEDINLNMSSLILKLSNKNLNINDSNSISSIDKYMLTLSSLEKVMREHITGQVSLIEYLRSDITTHSMDIILSNINSLKTKMRGVSYLLRSTIILHLLLDIIIGNFTSTFSISSTSSDNIKTSKHIPSHSTKNFSDDTKSSHRYYDKGLHIFEKVMPDPKKIVPNMIGGIARELGVTGPKSSDSSDSLCSPINEGGNDILDLIKRKTLEIIIECIPSSSTDFFIEVKLLRLLSSLSMTTQCIFLANASKWIMLIEDCDNSVYPFIAEGLCDRNPEIREMIMRSTVVVSEYLKSSTINGKLLKALRILQDDMVPVIRTNAVICIAKIHYKIESKTRKSILISVFSKGLKDQSKMCRVRSMLAISSTKQEYTNKDICRFFLPLICPHLVDDQEDEESNKNVWRVFRELVDQLDNSASWNHTKDVENHVPHKSEELQLNEPINLPAIKGSANSKSNNKEIAPHILASSYIPRNVQQNDIRINRINNSESHLPNRSFQEERTPNNPIFNNFNSGTFREEGGGDISNLNSKQKEENEKEIEDFWHEESLDRSSGINLSSNISLGKGKDKMDKNQENVNRGCSLNINNKDGLEDFWSALE